MKNEHGVTGSSRSAEDGRRESQLALMTAAERLQAVEMAAGVAIDITGRKSAESCKARAAAIASASHDAVLGVTIDGMIEAWNPAAEGLFGYRAQDAIGMPVSGLPTADRRAEALDFLARGREGEASGPIDTKWMRKDGTIVDVSVAVAPDLAPDGAALAISVVVRDISDRKEWEARQRMMTRELAHRVKNSFAVLQSILRATLKASPDPQDFAEAFSGRLHSLAAAQDILTATDWKYAELGALARHQLSTIAVNEGDRLTISGPTVFLAAEHSVPLALIFNELATNAIKHGALSQAQGRIELRWHVDTNAEREDTLVLTWKELGGPRIHAPRRRGFGSTLIEKSLVGAVVERHFEPGGLVCRIELALTPVGGISAGLQGRENN